ncbi:ABC transporter substrate-binding protein [Leptospira gomenensis]|uniref:Chorismate dehydratase n=1 Tax=Leptospira gomenensis TaxID=2484974 RepID=A0A5F1YB36_9LEPT|nr:menaquinone biosynthesis protein [Leptospira gomenensis]TGK34475.1 ABC transporter substrate-binding protein [Leptospira gomenensis]TGK41861.1 ABC transporter substrate-binding protein [Leptospira gomenensis]TGK44798.1 ABC transporter substrate-binding protein [Leptospira gomenensis]TGK65185.1 ABC transporter substrate-binding protein [Leptospira gomenensis]
MKIGIVKHLNARPLTWGFETDENHEIVPENPAVLKDYLINGMIDVGLISSIECIRNAELLNSYESTGVCAADKVRSILFFKNKREEFPPRLILTDNGSKTSVSLVRVLIHEESGSVPEVIPTDSALIQDRIAKGIGSHMLFGDNALLAKWNPNDYEVLDLAEWWHRLTGFGFIFALWASKKPLLLEESLFVASLQYGLSHIEEIVSHESRLPNELVRSYLTQELHYKVTEEDKKGFVLFGDKCKKLNIL